MTRIKLSFAKRIAAGFAGALGGLLLLGAAPAQASDRHNDCYVDHDRRSKHYDKDHCYENDATFKKGRKKSGSFVITVGDRRGYDRAYVRFDARGDRGYYNRRGRRGASELIKREVFRTRGRARVVLTEEVIYGRRRTRLVCTVKARGRDADLVPYRRLKRIAYNNCSRRARINIIA